MADKENDTEFLARKLFQVMYQIPAELRHKIVGNTFNDDAESSRYLQLVPTKGWTRRARRHLFAWRKEVN